MNLMNDTTTGDDVILSRNHDDEHLSLTNNEAQLGYLGESPRERNVNEDGTNKAESVYSRTDDFGVYPPGISVSGSSNLPIPEVEPNALEQKKKKRRRRTNKVGEMNGSEIPQQDSNSGSDSPKNPPLFQTTANGSIYPQSPPTVLPPISRKPTHILSAGAVLGSDVTKLEPSEKEKMEQSNEIKGQTNVAFVGDEIDGRGVPERRDYIVLENKKDETLCFDDKQRKIDYVLVYRAPDEEDKDDDCEKEKMEIRELYQENLKEQGVDLEIEPKEKSQDGKTCFVKLHVPWDVLLRYAERMKIKMPLKKEKDEDEDDDHPEDQCCDFSWYHRMKKKLAYPFHLHNETINEFGEEEYYTAEFSKDKIHFFDIKDEETFFSNPERSRIAHRIMDETSWGKSRKCVGINRLLLDDVYEAAYPLHDGSTDKLMARTANMRQLLYREWARWGRWYKYQPLDAIRSYLSEKIALYFAFLHFYTLFLILPTLVGLIIVIYGLATVFTTPYRHYLGDKIGIYFGWLGFYTHMLMYASVVGLIVLLYGVGSLTTFAPVTEICDASDPNYAGNFTMCPLCDADCTYWKLHTSCLPTRITYVFDNEATIFFAIFMSVWATLFLEFWKRRQFELSYEWDLVDYDEERDLVRPEYEAQVEREKFNPGTGRKETMMAPAERVRRTGFSVVNVILWVCLIIAAVFSVIIYRLVVHALLAASLDTSSLGVVGDIASPSLITTVTSSLISLVIIMILNKIYQRVALWLTNLEIPRTRVEFEDSFTMKVFCFQFVNFYSYLFYIAFFKNAFVGHPGNYTYLFDEYRWEGCEAGGCMYELTIQLLIIMFGKQAFNNILELFVPWAMNKYRRYKSKKAEKEEPENTYTRWEKDFDLAPLELDLFYEYLEMIIQFGFVTLFVCAFPLAPLLALLNNVIEVRLDAIKFISQFRRPLALKCSDIGAWYLILEFIATLAVVTNAFTIAITSEAIPKLVYYYFYSIRTFGQSTYVGFINNSLSTFDVSNFIPQSVPAVPQPFQPFSGETVTECRYKDYRDTDPPYDLTLQYWHVLAARLAFVIVMEHVVFFLKSFLSYAIPDRSPKLVAQIKREYYLVQHMLLQAEKDQILSKYTKDPSPKTDQSTSNSNGNTNSSNESGVVTYENEMKTTPM